MALKSVLYSKTDKLNDFIDFIKTVYVMRC